MIFIQNKIKDFLEKPYNVLLVIFTYTFIFGLFCGDRSKLLIGLFNIINSRSVLITDYVAVGGLGATLINVSVSSLLILFMYKILKLKPNGSILVAFWLCAGFSFFGKNVVNTWPIIFGVYLFAIYKRENFMRYSLPAVLATTLAPAVSEIYFVGLFQNPVSNILFALVIGLAIGFIMVPISSNAIKAHSGFNLYNVGFAAGILGILIVGVLNGLGLALPTRSNIWSKTDSLPLSIYLISVCLFLIIVGLYLTKDSGAKLSSIYKSSGRLVTDYYMVHKEATYINMGINGLFALLVVYLIGADVNGPTVGAIFTIIGFGCYGKHVNNMWPVMLGAILAIVICDRSLTEPSFVIAILFCTGLAPIAGTFGPFEGIIAGVIHIFIVTNVGFMHGGLNLYNNGFAAGFVAMILVPLITEFKYDNVFKKEDVI